MRQSSRPRLHLTMVLIAGLLFCCLPSVIAVAGGRGVPESDRSRQAVAQTSPDLATELADKGLEFGAPVFFRLTKQPAELTVFVKNEAGTYEVFRTWPVCRVSGVLGPKQREGDMQAPEGFYTVAPDQMNPHSSFHLSFNLGYPNAFDRAHGRTGSYLMVHGDCVSIGCFAMTDDSIEEIWTLMQAAFEGGQSEIPVHIFPFEMTAANLQRHSGHPDQAFWRSLAPAWVMFEETGQVPEVRVSGGAYSVGGAQ